MITPPSAPARAAAYERLDALAKPVGALGRLEDLAAWAAAVQGVCPPRPVDRIRAVILAGDHGVSQDGVSAYPREVTAAMVRAFAAGRAAANCLARQHGVSLRVLDLGVDDDLADLPVEISMYHVTPARPIHREDALTTAECAQALRAGRAIAETEIAAGADLLILGDMGIGNTTPAAALIAATFGLAADEVVGRGTGIDDEQLAHKTSVVATALARMGDRTPIRWPDWPVSARLISRLVWASCSPPPVAACRCCSTGSSRWPRSPWPSNSIPASSAGARPVTGRPSRRSKSRWTSSGLTPLLDLGLRLGEGTGALAAVPMLRSAVLLLREMARLADLAPVA